MITASAYLSALNKEFTMPLITGWKLKINIKKYSLSLGLQRVRKPRFTCFFTANFSLLGNWSQTHDLDVSDAIKIYKRFALKKELLHETEYNLAEDFIYIFVLRFLVLPNKIA